MTLLKEWLDYLYDRVGKSIYVWGAQGKKFKTWEEAETYIDRYETSATNKKRAKALLNKLKSLGVKIEDIQAFDCSGLGMYFFENLKGVYKTDRSAKGMYADCEKITKDQLKTGDQVFKYSYVSLKIVHVGYVVRSQNGELYVIECKGRDDGVIIRPLNVGNWNRYGRPPYLKSEIENNEGDIMINKDSDKELIKAWQSDLKVLGYDLGTYGTNKDGIDGSFGAKTITATKAFQKSVGLPESDTVDNWTMQKMVEVRSAKAVESLNAQMTILQKEKQDLASQNILLTNEKIELNTKLDKFNNFVAISKDIYGI